MSTTDNYALSDLVFSHDGSGAIAPTITLQPSTTFIPELDAGNGQVSKSLTPSVAPTGAATDCTIKVPAWSLKGITLNNAGLTTADVSAFLPSVEQIDFSNNSLSTFDASGLFAATDLNLSDNGLTQAALDQLLSDMDSLVPASGTTGTINVANQSTGALIDNGTSGAASADSLSGKGWTINHDGDWAPPIAPNIVFETNFSENAGYVLDGTAALWNGGSSTPVSPPVGWDAVKAGQGNKISVIADAEVGNALKLEWNPDVAQPTISLGKHLTGDSTTGYDELYIRYRVKLPNKFRVGTAGSGIAHWKWGRLWQNTIPDYLTNNWTENREDSYYVVWNWAGNVPFTDASATWGESTGDNRDSGSAGGPRQHQDYFVSGSDQHTSPGYFESVWDINTTDRPGELEDNVNQDWHYVEWRFKLASSPTADDGIFEMWVDGESWGTPPRITNQGGAPDRTGVPTASIGSGFNFLVFFDNIAGWHRDWDLPDTDGFILIDDLVVSTTQIGTSYTI